jgi:hypothetical protein
MSSDNKINRDGNVEESEGVKKGGTEKERKNGRKGSEERAIAVEKMAGRKRV